MAGRIMRGGAYEQPSMIQDRDPNHLHLWRVSVIAVWGIRPLWSQGSLPALPYLVANLHQFVDRFV
jgi:hypothetical protein